MKRAGFVLLWVAASFATALMAWSAVRLAGDQVSERPVRPLSADEVAALAATTLPPPAAAETSTTTLAATFSTASTATTPSSSSTTTTRPGSTTTSRPPRTTTTNRPPPPSSTTTSATTSPPATTAAPPSSTTTTTTSPPAPTVTAYQLNGGSVVISASPGQVSLVSASPRSGFTMEIESAGPAEVRVEFEGSGGESKFRARWSGRALDVDIDE